MTTRGRRRAGRRLRRWLALGLLPLALGGCTARAPEGVASEPNGVATVPPRFFTATVVAFPPSSPPQGRYTLGALALLDPGDPTGTYATALLQSDTKGLRLTLRADGLGTPAPPAVSYELVTASGVFRPLADGEWDRATAQRGGWTATGTLIFVIPRDLRAGRLDIVDYYYPQAHPETGPTPEPLAALARRILATFALDRLP